MSKSLEGRIIHALQKSGLVDEDRLKKILKEAKHKNEIVSIEMLEESGIISDIDLISVLSAELDIVPIDVSRVTLDESLMDFVSERIIRRYSVIPISRIGMDIALAVSDPSDIIAIDDVKTVTGCDVEPVIATSRGIKDALRQYYESGESGLTGIIGEEGANADVQVIGTEEDLDVVEIEEESKAAPIVKIVALIVSEAIKKRASDIHVEPQERSVRIRYRIDGELHESFDLPKKNQNAILARLKIMSNMDITETRVPQDGRFRIKLERKEIDFRVSALPTNFGNKIVLRALDKSNLSVGLETLGFLPGPLADFQTALARPFGIILVTGPTGSGKSTTLYSVLNKMNVPERSIITVEDPVEYQVEGITQIAARPEIGLDFAGGLRAILRQSPDVIMVGEIRDFETADIAIKASLTGQMVLSTLHTNDSVGAITRLVNMGVEPFLVASSLVLACAQRLMRKICPHCKAEAKIPKEELKRLEKEFPAIAGVKKFFKGEGCQNCSGTGYRGRMGTLETLLVEDEIKEMINSRRSEGDIRDYLKKKGIKTLRDNAMEKFIKGWTTLEEVLRVT